MGPFLSLSRPLLFASHLISSECTDEVQTQNLLHVPVTEDFRVLVWGPHGSPSIPESDRDQG